MDPNLIRSIAEQLRDDIRNGRLAPGETLRQESIAERFGVSRQPVRLAIASLRSQGWITPTRGRRLAVANMTDDARCELVNVRRLIEGEALTLAMPKRTDRDVLLARQVQERLEIETIPRQLEELDNAFHSALYAPCRNGRLLRLAAELRGEDRRPYEEQPLGSVKRRRWTRQHRLLLEAYSEGNADAALAILDSHLNELSRRP